MPSRAATVNARSVLTIKGIIMEFVSGILFTLFFGFIGNTIYKSHKKQLERSAYIPPAGLGSRPGKEFLDKQDR